MPEQLNITNLPSSRVEFIDPRTGLMSREWYRFFLNLFTLTGGGNNQTGWSNAEYDRLIRSALTQPDEAARMAVYQKLETILADELPVLPIYFYTRIYAISPKVKNWISTPLDNRAWKWVDLAD